MSKITVKVTGMSFRVGISSKGEILGSGASIAPYAGRFIQRQFDPRAKRFFIVAEYFYFDAKNEVCYFPRFDLPYFISYCQDRNIEVECDYQTPVLGKPTNFLMLPWVEYKNDKQKGCVEFLTDETAGRVRGVALQTGTGKTVSFIMGLQKLGRRSMITMTSRLEQWVKEITKYTTLEPDDLYVVQGVASLTKLFSQIDTELKPPIILASAKTIRLYMDYGAGYQHLPHPAEMCERLGIGIIGTDEYHEHFFTNYLIGLLNDPSLFIPITGTFTSSNKFIQEILNKFIPEDVQFVGGAYDRFVKVTAYTYHGGGYLIKPHNYTKRGMYSQNQFEKFLLSKQGRKVWEPLVNDAIIPMIKEHYINLAEKGERFLLLCGTLEMCNELEGIFRRVFKDKTVSAFYSGRPLNILEQFDMIISTPGSAGTGRDIAGLRTCFAFENTSSEVRNLQFIGRLRGPPQMLNKPEFIYLNMACIPKHEKYNQIRSALYGPRALEFYHRSIR